ncbi:hypothetical protein SAMN05661077_0325 [Thiohalorhabdus denitrificans]|uniref:Uncharacterized protein n=1 Tax=Thiohalorhabdus denitrificans TaxID=381306 RepID=A0A1G5AFQ9_9GAMM|nr:hypothetical protein SAMN05661077_0325 [Thiohalorhabdus denitrificans]
MKSTPSGCTPVLNRTLLRAGPLLALAAVVLAGCGPNRGPEYGAEPVEREALAIPPDLAAEPLAAQDPFPNLPDASQFRPGPRAAEADGEWAAKLDGNTLSAPVPGGWALGAFRAALVLQGAGIDEERRGMLRTEWLGEEALSALGVPVVEDGPVRFTVKARGLAGGGTRLLVQGAVRSGSDADSASEESVQGLLEAVRPAFGKRR